MQSLAHARRRRKKYIRIRYTEKTVLTAVEQISRTHTVHVKRWAQKHVSGLSEFWKFALQLSSTTAEDNFRWIVRIENDGHR